MLRPDLGTAQGAHAARPGQPRLPHDRRGRLLRLLRRRRPAIRATGYYSYDLGTWHVLVLNSNCAQVGGCGPGSAQEKWLQEDLAAHPAPCTVAMWHHPRFSSGEHGDDTDMRHLWKVLYDAGADVVLAGHDHTYERFAPQNPKARPTRSAGSAQFVVGTGGRSHLRASSKIDRDSEVRNNTTYGVLKLTLHAGLLRLGVRPRGRAARSGTAGTRKCH